MKTVKVKLKTPLDIDVQEAARHMPEFRCSFHDDCAWILNDDNRRRFFVLSFDENRGEGYTELSTQYPPKELAGIIAKLPERMGQQLRDALIGTKLELPELSEEDKLELARQDAERRAGERLLERANGVGQPYNSGRFSATEAQGILQHEIGLTRDTDAHPILASFGAKPCVIMAAYNPETHSGLLCHIDSLTTLSSLDRHIDKIKGNGTTPIEIHLVGGEMSSKKMVIALLAKIDDMPGLTIKSSNLIGNPQDSKSLAIDTRSGEIFTEFANQQITLSPNYERRLQWIEMQSSESPIQLFYDGLGEKKSAVDRYTQRGSRAPHLGNERTTPKPRNGSWTDDT
jgi:hypothetical protein